MGARFLDDEARAAFKQTIAAIESTSSVEVVIALRRHSAGYFHANLIVGALATFAGLAAMLFSEAAFSLGAILIDPFLLGGTAGGLVHFLPQVKRLLTPARVRRREVGNAARAAFVERGVHNTIDRSGLLVYISWLEQEVALVADSALERSITPALLAETAARLTRAMPAGGAAVARVLATLAEPAAAAMPRRAGDINELPDDIVSDYHPPDGADA